MLISSQNPDRVSNILRSSTEITRLVGILRTSGALVSTTRVHAVMALMLLLLLVVCRR